MEAAACWFSFCRDHVIDTMLLVCPAGQAPDSLSLFHCSSLSFVRHFLPGTFSSYQQFSGCAGAGAAQSNPDRWQGVRLISVSKDTLADSAASRVIWPPHLTRQPSEVPGHLWGRDLQDATLRAPALHFPASAVFPPTFPGLLIFCPPVSSRSLP